VCVVLYRPVVISVCVFSIRRWRLVCMRDRFMCGCVRVGVWLGACVHVWVCGCWGVCVFGCVCVGVGVGMGVCLGVWRYGCGKRQTFQNHRYQQYQSFTFINFISLQINLRHP